MVALHPPFAKRALLTLAEVAVGGPWCHPAGMASLSMPTCADVRRAALVAVCVVHGLAGETAPPGLGPVEIACGLLLAVAVDWRRVLGLFDGRIATDRGEDPAVRRAALALPVLLWPPLVLAAAGPASTADVARDLVPLAFAALALILPRAPDGGRTVRWLATGLVVAGSAMVVRAAWDIGPPGPGGRPAPWAGDLLLNDPSVAFAATALTLLALRDKGIRAVAAAIGAAAILWVLLSAGHRAGLAACMAAAAIAATRPPAGGRLVVAGLAVATAVLVGTADGLVGAVAAIADKTAALGLNARPAEFAAAVATAADGPLGLAFGQGWGARFVNPATGGDTVRYAHGLLPHLLLKTGLVGVAAGLVAATGFAVLVLRPAVAVVPVAVHAAWPALAVAAAVHTSHKFLTFGLLLALVVLACEKSLESQS